MNEALELGRGGKGKALGKSTLRPSAQPEGSSLSISRLSPDISFENQPVGFI